MLLRRKDVLAKNHVRVRHQPLELLDNRPLLGCRFHGVTAAHAQTGGPAATAVLVVIGVAMGLQLRGDFAASRRMSQLVSATLFTLVAVQCGYFYIDYFGRAAGGNPFRRALERVIEDASNRAAPALYMGLTGGFDYERWRFYLAKHGRTDLLARTVLRTGNVDADLERVRTLPPGSIVMITLGWAQMDRAVDKMAVEGELKVDQAIHRVVDNGAMYLILEKQR
jgi:hypothetical protein